MAILLLSCSVSVHKSIHNEFSLRVSDEGFRIPAQITLPSRDILLKDVYPIVEGYVYAVIYKDETTGLMVYYVVEPPLTDEDRKILSLLSDRLRDEILREKKLIEEVVKPYPLIPERLVEDYVRKALRELKLKLPDHVLRKYMYYIVRDVVGFGKIDPLLRDPYIEDININGPGRPVYIWHALYEHMRTNIVYDTSEEIYQLIVKISQFVGRNVSSANPILEGLLGAHARVEAVLSDVAPLGHCVNIRKFKTEPFTVIDLISSKTITPEVAAYLWLLIDNKFNIIIIGPTGSGKTTLLNSLLYLIRPECRIVTIEDTREINIPHEQWVPLVTRPSWSPQVREVTQFDLVKVSMRIRPDYLVVGEVRGEEAYVLFQAFASGHSGLTTLHADTIEAAIMRLLSKPMNVPKFLLRLAHVFCNIQRVRLLDKIVRRVVEVCEFLGFEKGKPILRVVYKYNSVKDTIERAEESIMLREISRIRFIPLEQLKLELERRKRLLEAMAKYGFRDPATVFKIVRNYYTNPEDTYHKVLSGTLP